MRLAVLLLAWLGSCALETPPPTTGFLPDNAFGDAVQGEDIAVAATGDAVVAFASAQRGDPAATALAVASLDAMAGQFSTGGRWLGLDQFVKLEMLNAREHVRAVLGIAATADSQTVIDGMVGAAQALQRHDQAGARAALAAPIFSLGPARTLAVLANFPYVQDANVATQAAEQNILSPDQDENSLD